MRKITPPCPPKQGCYISGRGRKSHKEKSGFSVPIFPLEFTFLFRLDAPLVLILPLDYECAAWSNCTMEKLRLYGLYEDRHTNKLVAVIRYKKTYQIRS